MSRSKRASGKALPERAGKAPRPNPLFDSNRRLRTGFRPVMALAACSIVALAVQRGLGAGLQALLRAWNVNANTVVRAPGWARTIYAWQGSLTTLGVNLAVIALSLALCRLWRLKPSRGTPAKGLLLWLAGTGIALLAAGLFLLADSLRLEWPLNRPALTGGLAALWALSLLTALAEELFTKGVVYECLRSARGGVWPAAAAALVFFLSNGGLAGSVISGINVLLLGVLCALLYARWGLRGVVGFRWGWSFAAVFLLGQGGGAHSVYRLYGVSENLITGGDGGFVYGLGMTLALAAALAWFWVGKRMGKR